MLYCSHLVDFVQVRVYSVAALESQDIEGDVCLPLVSTHRMPSKLASMAWSPDQQVGNILYP